MNWTKTNPIRAATHGCPQHLDELVALCLLRRWAEARGQRIEVHFLSREQIAAQEPYDVLVDIGQEFDVTRGRFDHHQSSLEVQGRSSTVLIFDALYADDPRREYLEPIIRHVDAIDAGLTSPCANTEKGDRGRSMVSVPALLKAVGGFAHDPTASQRCLDLISPLVASWLRQAEAYLQASDVVASAERVGRGIFLDTDEPYGPALLEYVQRETEHALIGFPAGPDRFQVVAVRGRDGHNRATFPPSLDGSTCVHPKGFMAVFADREAARASLRAVTAVWQQGRKS